MLATEKINPLMISIARESRGLQHSDFAEKLNISKSTAWRLEQGNSGDHSEIIPQLSKALHYPESFFYQKGEILPMPLSYRKRDVVSAKLLTQIEASINMYRLNMDQLLQAMNKNEIHLPVLDIAKYNDPQGCAKQLRKLWKLEKGTIENLSEVLEDKSVLLINTEFDTDRVDGRCVLALDKFPVIITNKNMLGDRQRFTLAYQLGHIVMHLHTAPSYERDLSHEANLFAAEFLMPEKDIKNDLQDLSLPKLGELKRKWKVSMQSLVYRANDLELCSDRNKRYILQQFNDRKIRRREPKELDIHIEQYKLVRDLLTKYRTKQKLSVAKMAAFLHLYEDDFSTRYTY